MEVARPDTDEPQRLPGDVASDTIARAQLAELATVDRERHVAPVDHDERDFIVLGENERAIEQHVRRDRREDDAAQIG